MTPTRFQSAAPDDAPLQLAAASSSMVLTLAYFSLFRHPLREDELLSYTHFYPIAPEEGRAAIRSLLDRAILEAKDGMLCLQGDAPLAAIRREREATAARWQPRVERSIRVLSHLPFLRGLSISGSLSKGTQDPDGDIDFFVLTAPNRLWISRFFGSLLLKVLPKAKEGNYCLNYYITEDRLSLPDRTLFSATEVVFLKPVLNGELLSVFFELNRWVEDFYPNWTPPEGPVGGIQRTLRQRLVEWPLAGRLGDLLEGFLSRWFIQRLNRQFSQLPPDRSAQDARVSRREYKGHTRGRHERTRQAWQQRVDRLEADLGIRLIRWPWAEAWGTSPVPEGRHGLDPAVVQPLKFTNRRGRPGR